MPDEHRKPTGQPPYFTGSKIARDSTCDVIGNTSAERSRTSTSAKFPNAVADRSPSPAVHEVHQLTAASRPTPTAWDAAGTIALTAAQARQLLLAQD
ncbi:hypothetical protein [Streptomyces avermitilis]|uniref:hypothetical protein n=1 Tax=Streptomyces avermitilis TaxID=33903 RepID=UPI0033ABB525